MLDYTIEYHNLGYFYKLAFEGQDIGIINYNDNRKDYIISFVNPVTGCKTFSFKNVEAAQYYALALFIENKEKILAT